MRNTNQYQEKENFLSSRSTINYLKPQIDKIFDIQLREPPILTKQSKSQKNVFKMSDYEKRKMDYLIQLGLQENVDEIKNPYFNFLYNVEIPDSLIRKWKIRSIRFNKDKLLMDIFQGQYMRKYQQTNTKNEQFLYPEIIGTQKLEQVQLYLNNIINRCMDDGTAQNQLKYPLREKYANLYLWSSLMFFLKFLYRLYLINIK